MSSEIINIQYEEPTLVDIVTLLALLTLLQLARWSTQKLFNAGLLGQITIGIIFGPLAHWLVTQSQQTILVLGYVALVLIVFQAGLDLDPNHFLKTFPQASATALVGILTPIALSFAFFNFAFPLLPTKQQFAVAVALSSTSLGTTFNLIQSRHKTSPSTSFNSDSIPPNPQHAIITSSLTTTLTTAALIDDIVALVLLSVLLSLGDKSSQSSSTGMGWIIGRPILASFLIATLSPLVAIAIRTSLKSAKSSTRANRSHDSHRDHAKDSKKDGKKWLSKLSWDRLQRETKLDLAICFAAGVLSAFLAIAYYSGTTMLLGAFVAGAFLFLLDPPSPQRETPSYTITREDMHENIFRQAFEAKVGVIQHYILTPFFFCSIGFTIPFLELWTKEVVWKGIVYVAFMTVAKIVAGFTCLTPALKSILASWWRKVRDSRRKTINKPPNAKEEEQEIDLQEAGQATSRRDQVEGEAPPASDLEREEHHRSSPSPSSRPPSPDQVPTPTTPSPSPPPPPPPLHLLLQQSLFLGLSLVPRGEIGLLVLQLANSRDLGLLTDQSAYLVGVWAVIGCTVLGSLLVGAWVGRM
ncbi:hypothetical protein T439DRAFT_320422 [Meredithblackwellia eburnea MCA 4105]